MNYEQSLNDEHRAQCRRHQVRNANAAAWLRRAPYSVEMRRFVRAHTNADSHHLQRERNSEITICAIQCVVNSNRQHVQMCTTTTISTISAKRHYIGLEHHSLTSRPQTICLIRIFAVDRFSV